MTEEEKKAIEDCKEFIEYLKNTGGLYYRGVSIKKITEALLNLIEKLKKEIEEKTIIIMAGAEKVKQLEKEFITKQEIKENYIPKDKIRDRLLVVTDLKSKIDLSKKETPVEFYVLDYVNNLLEELLEEG